MKWLVLFAAAMAMAACSEKPTEVIVSVDSNLSVPGEFNRIGLELKREGAATQSATAALGDGEPALPRTIGLVHEGGPLGPYEVTVTGFLGAAPVVGRTARFHFVAGETRVLEMHLVRSCIGTSCGADETCSEAGCVSVDVPASALLAWTGSPPRLDASGTVDDGGPDGAMDGPDDSGDAPLVDGPEDSAADVADAGCDAGAVEICNGIDDDCNMLVDEGFDLQTDEANCGGCGILCDFQNGTGQCTNGICTVGSCNTTFDDCDDDGRNGCETDLMNDRNHCGSCANVCRGGGPRRCCTGGCVQGSTC